MTMKKSLRKKRIKYTAGEIDLVRVMKDFLITLPHPKAKRGSKKPRAFARS